MQVNDQKITKEFCKGKTLIFFPRSFDEAVFIQRQIFKMGFKWGKGSYDFEDSSTTVIDSDARLLEGLLLEKNKEALFARPDTEELRSGVLCDPAQLDETYLPPQQQVMEQFNKLSDRVEQVAAMVDELRAEMSPKKLDKPLSGRML